jgi:hypothetical protein
MVSFTSNSKYFRFSEVFGQDSFYMIAVCASAAAGLSVDELRK